jgi:hypothetical protein
MRLTDDGAQFTSEVAHWHLFTATAANLQALCDIQAMHAFVIRAVAGLAPFQMDHAGPVATMPIRQGKSVGSYVRRCANGHSTDRTSTLRR